MPAPCQVGATPYVQGAEAGMPGPRQVGTTRAHPAPARLAPLTRRRGGQE
jgi:hypothetical protein